MSSAEARAETRTSLNSSKSISIEFLPPYSPFLNPIKYLFHSIKAYAITPQKSKNFFTHCCHLYHPCTEMQDINGALLNSPPE
ncbi:hypothetical protein VP01_1946g6 [Puccinia sorghi]|uniref:Tc1-like transposase DDE domain-containing protein n=1 Tax=Puccinia sorghi TaxID=27349 RepID=A0A0L6VCS5_9BASI|nr:hypothetical protein VP01_1946g6 [Puccinia sorghi]